jgi:serine/threonine protein kinase
MADSAGSTLWKGYDQRLRRSVSVRLTPLGTPLAARLRDAATLASAVTDRRVVPILDIVADKGCRCLVVVSEWVTGTPLGESLTARKGEPLPAADAATLSLEVARFLAAAHAAGVTHGHLRPNAVTITDTGEVRVRGLGVDQALYGVEPDIDPHLADVHAAGAVLFAGLTGRWPGGAGEAQMPEAPRLPGGKTPWPSRVVADVPADLDEIAGRALQTTGLPKGRPRYTTVDEVVAALTTAVALPAVAPSAPGRTRGAGRTVLRIVGVMIALAASVGLALLGLKMVLGFGGTPLTSPRTDAPTGPTVAPSSAVSSAPPVVQPTDQVLPIVNARDFDPYGNRQENPSQVPFAVDKDQSTVWTTQHYSSSSLGGKKGVGIILDLGIARPVSGLKLRLVGNGTDLVVYATDNPASPIKRFTVMATVSGAPNVLTVRVPKPISTRYVIVFLTGLPAADGSYQGGIADVQVIG